MWGKSDFKRLDKLNFTKQQIDEISDKTNVGVTIITEILLTLEKLQIQWYGFKTNNFYVVRYNNEINIDGGDYIEKLSYGMKAYKEAEELLNSKLIQNSYPDAFIIITTK